MEYLYNKLPKMLGLCIGLLIALLNTSFGDSPDLIYLKANKYAITPDTIPFDTIKVVSINSNGDSATVVISGADSITYLHSDPLINYIEDGIPEVYILGDIDSSVTIKELLGDSLYIIQKDSTFIAEIQYIDSVAIDTSITVLISSDTIYLRTDTIAYFIGTDTGAYYIPQNETTVYKVIKADSAQLVDSTNTTLGKLILPLVHSKGIIITPQGGSENSSDVPNDLFGIGLEGMFNPRHISEEDVIPEPPGTWVPNPDAWTWMADLKPGSLRFPGGESGKFMHLLPYRDLDIDGTPDPIRGYGYDIEEIIRFYDITPAPGDPALPTAGYPETYGVEMTNTNVNETFIDVGGSSVPVTMAAILADLADDDCISCKYWMDTRYIAQLLDYYGKYTQQQALPNESATYDPAYINQFVDFIDFIQTQNAGYSIDIYLDLNIISQTPSEARAIVDYLRDGDINGVTDITVAGVELSNEVYFNWARDLAGFAIFNDYWAYVTGDVNWGDYTNDLGVLTHFTTITEDNPLSYADYVLRPELYDNTATTYDPSHDFFAALKASPPVNIGLPAENPNGSDLVNGPEEDVDYLLGGSDAWNFQLRSHYDDMFSPGVPLFDAVILHNYFQGSKYKDLILNNLCHKYPTYPGWSTPPYCLYSGICDPYGEWRYDVSDFRVEDAFNEFMGLTDPPAAWDDVVNLSDLLKGGPLPDDGLPGYFYLLKDGDAAGVDAYGLQFGSAYDNNKQLWATEYNNKPTTSNMSDQESKLMDIFLNNFPDGLLLFEWSLFNIRINSNALYHKDFFTASHFHAYAGGGESCLLTIADCGDFKNFVNPSGVPSPIDPDPYKVPGPAPDENLYLRRTSYWSMKLISEINKQDLYYLHSNYLMPTGNPNVPPTLFRDPGFDYIVLFISNMKEGPQYITINPSSIAPFIFPAFLGFDDYVTINEVQVGRNYMSSGMSNMFDINTCYNCVKDLDVTSDNPHPFDIYGITPTFNRPVEYVADIPNGIRFYMDGNSFGYVTIPILKIPERVEQSNPEKTNELVEIAPNPTNSSIKFWSDAPGVLNNDAYNITISSSTGQVMIEGNWKAYEDIDVTTLPSGIYFITISTNNSVVATKKLIKSS